MTFEFPAAAATSATSWTHTRGLLLQFKREIKTSLCLQQEQT